VVARGAGARTQCAQGYAGALRAIIQGSLIGVQVGVGPQVQVLVVELPVEVFHRQSLLSAFSENAKDSVSVSHLEYLSLFLESDYLPFHLCPRGGLSPSFEGCPLVMCRVLPGADYYEGTVAVGLASRKRSRVPSA